MQRTAAIVAIEMAVGDAAEQHISGDSAFDCWRSMRLGVTGLVTTGPLAHLLFTRLEAFSPGTSWRVVLRKSAANAAFMPMMLSATFATAWILEGRGPTEIRCLLSRELVPACTTGIAFWPMVNLFVYKAVAPPWRPAVSSAFGGLWGVYLAARCASASEEPAVGPPKLFRSMSRRVNDAGPL